MLPRGVKDMNDDRGLNNIEEVLNEGRSEMQIWREDGDGDVSLKMEMARLLG
ncbi:hypothetical protein Sjap_004988 [Stephania japonica]|uniref:Uncharacterized protein n=1 Tax=Stephania japonica TaxID=461633 RepID=A0AAP0K488_9MAGN